MDEENQHLEVRIEKRKGQEHAAAEKYIRGVAGRRQESHPHGQGPAQQDEKVEPEDAPVALERGAHQVEQVPDEGQEHGMRGGGQQQERPEPPVFPLPHRGGQERDPLQVERAHEGERQGPEQHLPHHEVEREIRDRVTPEGAFKAVEETHARLLCAGLGLCVQQSLLLFEEHRLGDGDQQPAGVVGAAELEQDVGGVQPDGLLLDAGFRMLLEGAPEPEGLLPLGRFQVIVGLGLAVGPYLYDLLYLMHAMPS